MDRHTHLLASILQTCTMLHPDDPRAAVDHANRILDQVELYDQERYTRPLAAELDEELNEIQDELLPDPGDMIPHHDSENDQPGALLQSDVRSFNDHAFIHALRTQVDILIGNIVDLERNLAFDNTSDPYEEVRQILHRARILSAYFSFRNENLGTWKTAFWQDDALERYIINQFPAPAKNETTV